MKNLIFTLIVFTSIILFIAPAKSQTYPIIKADTVFKGYSKGETSSIRIINHGTRIVYNYNGKLYEMNALNYKPIRDIALDDLQKVSLFSIDENCKYIIYNTDDNYKTTFIADYNTGKKLKIFSGSYYLSKDYLYLYYKDSLQSFPNVYFKFARLNINTLTPIDSFNVEVARDQVTRISLGGIRCIYNKNDIVVEIVSTPALQYDGYLPSSKWCLLNFSTGKIEPYGSNSNEGGDLYIFENGNAEVKVTYSYKQVSSNPPGYILLDSKISTSSYGSYLYLTENGLKKMFDDESLSFNHDFIITGKYLLFSINYEIDKKQVQRILVWDIQTKTLIKMIDFSNHCFAVYKNKIVLGNYYGCLATINLD